MVTSFLCVIEKRGQAVAQLRERDEPGAQQLVTLVGERVRALRRAREIAAPLGGDETLVFERPQGPVQVPDVDALLARQLGQSLDELVPMCGTRSEQREKGGLAEALDPCPDLPAALAERAVPGALSSSSAVHGGSICKLHMSLTHGVP